MNIVVKICLIISKTTKCKYCYAAWGMNGDIAALKFKKLLPWQKGIFANWFFLSLFLCPVHMTLIKGSKPLLSMLLGT